MLMAMKFLLVVLLIQVVKVIVVLLAVWMQMLHSITQMQHLMMVVVLIQGKTVNILDMMQVHTI